MTFTFYLYDHNIVLFGIICSLALITILSTVSWGIVTQNRDEEKISSYECGFQPFEDSRQKFDIKYYLVAILFIVFDLEIMILVPGVKVAGITGLFGLLVLCVFAFILTIGFAYEIYKGVLLGD